MFRNRFSKHSAGRLSQSVRPRRLLTMTVALAFLLALGSQLSMAPVIAQDAPPVEGDRFVVDVDALNFRDGQGSDSDVIEVLPQGTEVTFVSLPTSGSDDSHDWYNVDLDDGTNGWVAGEFLAPIDTGDSFTIGTTVEVATDEINLRAEPGLDAEILDLIPSGRQAAIDSLPESLDGYTWYRLNFDDGAAFGWAAGELLAFVSGPPTIAVGDQVMVATDKLSIRSEAGLDSDVLDTVANGLTASVTDGPISADGFTWYEIETDAVTGWVAGEYLVVQ